LLRGVMAAVIALPLLIRLASAGTRGERISPVIELPAGAPVALVSAQWNESRVCARGSARFFELRGLLVLQNSGPGYIRGISMAVVAGEHALGGKGLVRSPVLNIPNGVTFPIAIALVLSRPVEEDDEAVKVRLDGVLFDDLRFYGPNASMSRQWLITRELNAYPERQRLKGVLQHSGARALQSEILALLHGEVTPTTEGLRLADFYRERGMAFLIEELNRF